MPVDSYKFLPRSFRDGYANVGSQADEPVWTPLPVPIEDATVALLTSAGLYLEGEQQPFDIEREQREPTWGDPGYRAIPRDVQQAQLAASHLHINTRDLLDDVNVALPIARFAELEAEGRIGRLAEEQIAVMGFQERRLLDWRERTGPEIAKRLSDAGVHALVLAPA